MIKVSDRENINADAIQRKGFPGRANQTNLDLLHQTFRIKIQCPDRLDLHF